MTLLSDSLSARRLTGPLLLAGVLAPASCADTEGSLVSIEAAVASAGSPEPFVTATGWQVKLDEAWVTVAAFRAYASSGTAARWSPLRSVARAHGGNDPLNGRRVRAEWLAPVVIDALDPGPRWLGPLEAETGSVDEVGVTLEPPADDRGPTRGHQLWVSGLATKDGVSIRFEGGVDLPGEGVARRVENIALEAAFEEGDRWVLVADPRVWLADANFDRLPAAPPGEPTTIPPGGQVHGALLLGLRSARAWSAAQERDEDD